MRSYEFYRELEEAVGGPGSASREVWRLVDRAVRSSADGIVITDARRPDDPIVFVNPGFERMTGYTAQEAIGKNCRFLQDGDRDQPALEELRAALMEGRECRVVLRNYRKDGAPFWNELHISPVFDEGDLANFVGVQIDITERKEIEESLDESEERLRLAVESTGLGTWDFYPSTGELRWDERCKAIFGLPSEAEVDYETFLARLHPEDREHAGQAVGRALDPAGDGKFDIEYRTIGLEDGVERWVAARGRAFFDEAGLAARFIGTVLDVTERKKVEEELDLLLRRERAAREEAEAARGRLELLTRAGTALSSSLDYEVTVARVARTVVPGFAGWCLVDVIGEDGALRQLAASHANPEREPFLRELGERRELQAGELEGSARISARALRTGEAILLPDITDELLVENTSDETYLALLRMLGPRSVICAPLLARGRALGVILLVSSDRRYNPEDLSFAKSLAHRCALAIDNSRLYRDRVRVARALQESLLPLHLPEVPGVEVGMRYLPAGEAEVGGDFYDLFDARKSGGLSSWSAVIGDVSGKGPEAAAVLALARHTIRASAMHQTRPAAILADLNEALLHRGRERNDRKFCTLAYARLDTRSAKRGAKRVVRVSVSCGGHPAPMLLKACGVLRRVGYPGRALGVFEDPKLTEQDVLLSPGDALILFTDGVTEARAPDGAFFGEERLANLLRSSAGLGAPAIASRIESAVRDFQDGDLHDDVAILALRVLE